MRLVRRFVVLVGLSLVLGASVASAAERPSAYANQEVSGMARILAQIQALLKSIWENDAGHIDPWGGSSGAGTQEDPSAPSTDEGCHIDPWGGCGSSR